MSSDLSVQAEPLPGSQVNLTIEVPQAKVDAAFDRVMSRLVQKVKVEGFRPGKAPRALVEARIGPAALREEVIDSLVPEVLKEALDEQKIDAIDRPRVDIVELERGRPARFTAKVSVMPEVKVPELDSIKVEKPRTEVTNEMVERRLAELLDRLAEIEPVEREVRAGDLLVADLDLLVDGAEVPSEARRAMEAEVKPDVLIPELLALLPGTKAGETVQAEIQLAADHTNPDLAGKPAQLRMTVQGVKEKRVPDLTDAIAKELSGGDQDSVIGFRAAVRTDLEAQAARLDDLNHEQLVLKAVVEGSEVDIPQSLVNHEIQHRLEDFQQRLQTQGLRLDRYLEYLGQTPEQYLAAARPDAEARLKVDLVLEEVGRREGIEPSDEEVLAHMEQEAAKDPELAEKFTELAVNPAARDYFRHRLTRLRILERLVEKAQGQGATPLAKPEEG